MLVQFEFTATVRPTHEAGSVMRTQFHTCVHSSDGINVFCWCTHSGLHTGDGLHGLCSKMCGHCPALGQ